MSYILSAQRDFNVVQAFQEYRQYLERAKATFPSSAYELAISPWYFDFQDHRCPHDAWLDKLQVSESPMSDRKRSVSARITLIGAYHDLVLEFHYPVVSKYRCDIPDSLGGHRDWLYDEFRLSDSGDVVHEIEWRGPSQAGSWVIEASDVLFQVKPILNTNMNGGGS
jgi:hypothetical protein